MIKKLKYKFVLATMSIVTGMLLIIFTLIYFFTAWNLNTQAESMLKTLHLSSTPGVSQQQLVPLPYFTVHVSAAGNIAASGVTDLPIDDQSFLLKIINDINREGNREGYLEKYNLQYSMRTGYADLTIALLDISGHKATLLSLVHAGIPAGLLAIGVFLGLSILLAKWSVRPVEDAWQKQKQFISDASHELKTPLTVIMSNAELLQTDDWTEEEKQRFSRHILTMTHQMRHLVEGMLELTRADNGQIKKLFAPVDLSRLADQCVLPFEPVLFEKRLLLETDIAEGIQITGSENHLRQVLEILLDNAGKYATPGIVDVRLTRSSKHCLLTVASPGNPIPQEKLTQIFERFFRVDAARERNGSFGLGLSIAKTIVTDHGGKIWAQSNESGNCFFVQLPM